MQIMVDTNEEERPGLIAAARLLLLAGGIHLAHDFFDMLAPVEAARPPAPPIGKPNPTPAPVIPLPPGNAPVAPVVHPEYHPDGKPPEVVPPVPADVPVGTPPPELAALFGGAGTGTPPAVATGPASAPPAPSMTSGTVSPATTAPAAPSAGAPAADTPPTSATTDPALASERDTENLPWDKRVHSETGKKNADGTWRYRRNLDPALKAAVYAELKAQYGAQVSLPQPPASVAGAVPVPAPAPPVPGNAAAAGAVPAPPAPSVPAGAVSDNGAPAPPVSLQQGSVPVPPAPNVGMPDTANTNVVPITSARVLTQKINTAQGAGLLTPAQVQEALTATGLDSITALFNQPAKVPEVDAYLRRWVV